MPEIKETPLNYKIEDGEIVIRIGIGTLAFCAQMTDPFNAYDERLGDWRDYWIIKDKQEFAKDFVRELSREGEDGSTPLTMLLDKIAEEVLEQGCIGIEEAPVPEYEDEDDE